MQMGRIITIGRAHRPNFLPARNERSHRDIDPVKMRIHRMQTLATQGPMPDDKQFSPTRRRLASAENHTIGHRKNRISQVSIHAADAIEIIPKMVTAALVIHFPKFLRIVHHSSMLCAHREIKSRGLRDLHRLPRGENVKTMIRQSPISRHRQAGFCGDFHHVSHRRPPQRETQRPGRNEKREKNQTIHQRTMHGGNTASVAQIIQESAFRLSIFDNPLS